MQYQIMHVTFFNNLNPWVQFETLMYQFGGGEQHTSAVLQELALSALQLRELAFRKTTLQTKRSL
jgi:hypothetical protein